MRNWKNLSTWSTRKPSKNNCAEAYEMQKFGDMRPATIEELQKFPKVVALLEKQRREQSTQGAQFFEKGVEQGLFLKGIDYTIVDSIMRNTSRCAASATTR